MPVVVPSYRLVWYNLHPLEAFRLQLLFPVIAWYDIIDFRIQPQKSALLFPVIAWYDIIGAVLGNK